MQSPISIRKDTITGYFSLFQTQHCVWSEVVWTQSVTCDSDTSTAHNHSWLSAGTFAKPIL